MQDLSYECLPYPQYTLDFALSDFHVFGPLKDEMGGKSFRSDESRRCMSGCAISQKVFVQRYPCTSEALEHFYGTQLRLRRKMKSLCTFCVQ